MSWFLILLAETLTLMLCGYLLGRFGYGPWKELREVNKAVKIMEHRRRIRSAFAAGYRYRMLEEEQQRKSDQN